MEDERTARAPRRVARPRLVSALVVAVVVVGGAVAISSRPDEPRTPERATAARPTVTVTRAATARVVSEPAVPVPRPFPRATLARAYPSDSGTRPEKAFTAELSGFATLRHHPEVLAPVAPITADEPLSAANDEVAVMINTGASDARVRQAESDATTPAYLALAPGLGRALGPIYREALIDGRLPKTRALLDGRVQQGWRTADAKAAHPYARPYVRLGFTTGGSCARSDFEGTGRIERSGDPSYEALCAQGSFPSGHTHAAFLAGTVLATLLPELAPQIIDQAATLGQSRVVLGFHYPVDVIGGRITGQAIATRRWSDAQFRPLLEAAHHELETVLAAMCRERRLGATVAQCARADGSFPSAAASVARFDRRADGGLPAVAATDRPMRLPAGVSNLLRTRFPNLTAAQRRAVLVATARESGEPLDTTSDGEASWERVDLVAAMAATVELRAGRLVVNGSPAPAG